MATDKTTQTPGRVPAPHGESDKITKNAKGVKDSGWQERGAESDMTPRKGEGSTARGEKR